MLEISGERKKILKEKKLCVICNGKGTMHPYDSPCHMCRGTMVETEKLVIFLLSTKKPLNSAPPIDDPYNPLRMPWPAKRI